MKENLFYRCYCKIPVSKQKCYLHRSHQSCWPSTQVVHMIHIQMSCSFKRFNGKHLILSGVLILHIYMFTVLCINCLSFRSGHKHCFSFVVNFPVKDGFIVERNIYIYIYIYIYMFTYGSLLYETNILHLLETSN